MEYIYLVKGLDCANCAGKFEEEIKKIQFVEDANMNFLSEKLIVTSSQDCTESITTIGLKFEDGLKIRRIK